MKKPKIQDTNCGVIKTGRRFIVCILLVGCISFDTLLGQGRIYQQVELTRGQWKFEALDTLVNPHIYKIQDVYVISYRDNRSAWFDSQKVEARSEDGQLVFKTSSNGVDFMDPVVFKTGSQKDFDIMLLGEETDGINLGFRAYLIKGSIFKSMGRIDVAVYDDLGYYKSVLSYLDITSKGKEIVFRFDTGGEMVFQPNTGQEQVYLAKNITYVYRNDTLELRLK